LYFTAIPAYRPPTSRLSTREVPEGTPSSRNASLRLARSSACSRSDRPIFHPAVRPGVRKPMPRSPSGAAPRVWLPSRRILELSLPGKPLSAPNAPELRPSELCSSRMIERRLPFPSPLLRFLAKPSTGLAPTLQRLDPTRKAVPLIRNPTFYVESGTSALLGFATSQALSPRTPAAKHLPSRLSLSALPNPRDLAVTTDS